MHQRIRDILHPDQLRLSAQELRDLGVQLERGNPHSAAKPAQQATPPEVHVMNLGDLDHLPHRGVRNLSIANYFAPRFFAEHHLAIMAFRWRGALECIIHYSEEHGSHFATTFGQRFHEVLVAFCTSYSANSRGLK